MPFNITVEGEDREGVVINGYVNFPNHPGGYSVTRGTLRSVTVAESETHGVIASDQYTGVTIDNCIIRNNSGHGITIGCTYSGKSTVKNTLVYGNSGIGIAAGCKYTFYMYNTTVVNNNADQYSPAVSAGSSVTVYMNDSIISFNRGNGLSGSGTFRINHSLFYGNYIFSSAVTADYDENTLFENPRFADFFTDDFRLDCSSPAVGTASHGGERGVYQGCVNSGNYYGPFYVHSTGNDATGDGNYSTPFKTLGRAANQSLPHDEIIIKTGTLVDNITLPKNVKIYGEDRDSTILEGTITLFDGPDAYSFAIGTVKNLTITGPWRGISGGDRYVVLNVDNCIIKDKVDQGIVLGANEYSTSIIKNTLIYNTSTGITASGKSLSKIYNTTIVDNRGYGTISSGNAKNTILDSIVAFNQNIGVFGAAQVNYTDLYGNSAPTGGGATVGLGTIYTDPLFVDNSTRDYRLMCTSGAVDSASAGSNMGYWQGETSDCVCVDNDMDGYYANCPPYDPNDDDVNVPGGSPGYAIPEFSSVGLVLIAAMFALLLVYRKKKE